MMCKTLSPSCNTLSFGPFCVSEVLSTKHQVKYPQKTAHPQIEKEQGMDPKRSLSLFSKLTQTVSPGDGHFESETSKVQIAQTVIEKTNAVGGRRSQSR